MFDKNKNESNAFKRIEHKKTPQIGSQIKLNRQVTQPKLTESAKIEFFFFRTFMCIPFFSYFVFIRSPVWFCTIFVSCAQKKERKPFFFSSFVRTTNFYNITQNLNTIYLFFFVNRDRRVKMLRITFEKSLDKGVLNISIINNCFLNDLTQFYFTACNFCVLDGYFLGCKNRFQQTKLVRVRAVIPKWLCLFADCHLLLLLIIGLFFFFWCRF